MGDTWVTEVCDHCRAENWVCMGDPTDCTSNIGEGPVCKCWRCGELFWRKGAKDDYLALESYGYDLQKSDEDNLKECDTGTEGISNPSARRPIIGSREAEGIVRFNRDWYLLAVPRSLLDELLLPMQNHGKLVLDGTNVKPTSDAHVSIAKGEAPCENAKDWGKKFVGDKVKFKYLPRLEHENGRHVWVNCYSPGLCEIREHFGLVTMKTTSPTVYRVAFHMTLGKLDPPQPERLRPQFRLSPRTHIDQGTLMQHI